MLADYIHCIQITAHSGRDRTTKGLTHSATHNSRLRHFRKAKESQSNLVTLGFIWLPESRRYPIPMASVGFCSVPHGYSDKGQDPNDNSQEDLEDFFLFWLNTTYPCQPGRQGLRHSEKDPSMMQPLFPETDRCVDLNAVQRKEEGNLRKQISSSLTHIAAEPAIAARSIVAPPSSSIPDKTLIEEMPFSPTLDAVQPSTISPSLLCLPFDFHDLPNAPRQHDFDEVNSLNRCAKETRQHMRGQKRCTGSLKNGGRNLRSVSEQEKFTCSYATCIDKQTKRVRQFKRLEHKNRHEKTVHEKSETTIHRCWVPNCHPQFSRSDNFKSHLRNTHSTKSGRNRYVATLDENNKCYDPEWTGKIDEKGYPILH